MVESKLYNDFFDRLDFEFAEEYIDTTAGLGCQSTARTFGKKKLEISKSVAQQASTLDCHR